MTDTTTEGLTLSQPVLDRISEVGTYIALMRQERQGYGPEAEREVTETMYSWLRAISNLFGAAKVWTDGVSRPLDSGRPELSFGGDMSGTGYYFGIISRIGVGVNPDAKYPPIEWSFHS